MIKKFAALTISALCIFAAAGCGENTPPVDNSALDADILASLEEQYHPDMENVPSLSGKIDVEMILGKLVPGWEAVAKAYMDIQPGVYVTIDKNQSSASYTENLKNALNSSNSDWDIVQGNYQNSLITSKGVNMYTYVSQKNAYAGKGANGKGVYWDEVLSKDAYQTDKSGSNSSVYILNSEFLSTGWFVQEEAFNKAVELGYKNADGKAEMPVQWDDVISLSSYMQQAGYTNPLGIAGNAESIGSSQFAWLFRVYGDQYYRELTPLLMAQEGDYNYDEDVKFTLNDTDTQPESKSSYVVSAGRLMNLILDKTSENYNGPTSARYKEFIGQLAKMKNYIGKDFSALSLDQVRSQFQYQSQGAASPQILLDYSGYYLTHTADATSKGTVSYFDYPYMTGENVNFHFVRDVGGNGGYLSIVDHGKEQNDLNLDFIKFFMSPYGQSVYYGALQKNSVAPDGLSTVRNGQGKTIFAVPTAWESFFANETLTYNGLCDMSQFTNNLIYHFNGNPTTISKNKEFVWYLFDGTYSVDKYADEWYQVLFDAYQLRCTQEGWRANMYQTPSQNPSASVG